MTYYEICCEPEPKPGHSSNRDYSIRYGKNSKANKETADTKLSKESGQMQGLTDRKPL